MSEQPKVLMSWSTGKDCAWALHTLRGLGFNIYALTTTITRQFNRVSMHGVRRALLEQQAECLKCPVWPVEINWPCANGEYETEMVEALSKAIIYGVEFVAFGDLFLRDVRTYREKLLAGFPRLKPLFPLWGLSTKILAQGMIQAGMRAVITTIDKTKLPIEFLGREFTTEFLRDLPSNVDPCGENGEFHTFCFDGPLFNHPIPFMLGEQKLVDNFGFIDLVPTL